MSCRERGDLIIGKTFLLAQIRARGAATRALYYSDLLEGNEHGQKKSALTISADS